MVKSFGTCTKCNKGSLVVDSQDSTMLRCDACGTKIPAKRAQKSDAAETRVAHMDIMDLDWDQNTEPMTMTPEGYLKGRACLTNVGVFTYTQANGTKRRELRLPEEVFNRESLDTLKLKPLTILHPDTEDGFVSAANVAKYDVGTVGEAIYNDPYRVYGSVVIMDATAVAKAKDSLSCLSCGYDCAIEYTSGVWMGNQYDVIQRKIVYNHLALVPRGRAGDDVALRFDSADSICDVSVKAPGGVIPTKKVSTKHKEGSMPGDMKKCHVDGVEYEAEAPVVQALYKASEDLKASQKRLDEAEISHKSTVSAVEAERDTFKSQVTKLQSEVKAHVDGADAKVEAAVQRRIRVLSVAALAGVEVKKDMAELDIETAVITKAFPSLDLKDRDASYRVACFDRAEEVLKVGAGEDSQNRVAGSEFGGGQAHQDGAAGKPHLDEAEASHQKYLARLNAGWQDPAAK